MHQVQEVGKGEFQQFVTGTTKLLGHEIRDPQARRFNHLLKQAMRQKPGLAPELQALSDLRNRLAHARKNGAKLPT